MITYANMVIELMKQTISGTVVKEDIDKAYLAISCALDRAHVYNEPIEDLKSIYDFICG